jgi:site-specific DNA recombinase
MNTLFAAVYTRFSSDRQRDSSTHDQFRNCDRRLTAERLQLHKHYADEAISGTTTDRPGYQEMLADADAGKFQVLLIDDLSRLGRDQVETERAIRRLEFRGVRILAVSDGYDSTSKARKIHRGAKNLVNEIYIDDLREKTHRGLEGQALRKYSAGGKAYGFKGVPVFDPARADAHGIQAIFGYKREIHPEQAEIVREIFQRTIDGDGLKGIASDLNARGIPAPGATWNRKKRRKDGKWLASAVRAILENELYTGRYVWNKSKWERDPESHQRKRVERPESEWVVNEMPELAIVSKESWAAVRMRRKERAKNFGKARGGTARYLLSGLLECGVCGSKFIVSGTYGRYVCSSREQGGVHACANTLRISREVAEKEILARLVDRWLSPEATTFAIEEMRVAWKAAHSAPLETQTADLDRLDKEIEQLEGMVKAGLLSSTIAGAAIERARTERQSRVRASARRVAAADDGPLREAEDAYTSAVTRIREGLLQKEANVQKARMALGELVEAIKLSPNGDHLMASFGIHNFALRQHRKSDFGMVAGAGFEPATFGL